MTIAPRDERYQLASGVELHTRNWDPVAVTQRPWLLVHGLASNARMWDGVASHLAGLGHPVVAVDLRGHGHSSKPDDGYDMSTVADDLHFLVGALATTKGWGPNGMGSPGIAGQSWGGNVVLELAARHPGDVEVVACVDGGFIELQNRFPIWDDAAEALAPPRLAGTPLEQMEGWITASSADWPESGRRGALANFEVFDDGTIAPWLTFDRHMQVLRGLWEHSPESVYRSITSPVLLIVADTGDVAWTHSKQDAVDAALEALSRGRAEWFRPAHHDVHAQHPVEVGDLLHRAVTDPDFFADFPPSKDLT